MARARVKLSRLSSQFLFHSSLRVIMAMKKAMKAMKGMKKSMKSGAKAMAKGALVRAIAEQNDLKSSQVSGILNSLATFGAKETKKAGIFAVPGLCRIKTGGRRPQKPAPGRSL